MSAQENYEKLVEYLQELGKLSSCSAVIGWDERTYMPAAGATYRAEMRSLLSGMIHERFVDPKVGDWLSAVEDSDLVKDDLSPTAVNIRETRRAYDKLTKLPKDLVEEISKVTTLAHNEWVKARKNSDFKSFQPWLKKVVDLQIKKAEAYGFDDEPYSPLLDDYETGATVADISEVFTNLRKDLVELLGKIKGAPKKPDASIVNRVYPTEKQKLFGEAVAQAMGFDFNAGRLDVTTHPFCSGIAPGDTRITTRYNPHRINDALFGIMHEAGHGLYEMGLPDEYHALPMGESVSLGIHESQSRMWENQVGRSKSFWKYFFPQAQRLFRDSLNGVTLDEFYGAINNVQPSYIRVEADEATYNLHILLRFEMERAMLTGDLRTEDVAVEWNKRFKEYFGVEVDKDANGCLQDIHWSSGYIGYFPTYTLGNLYSAQFFAQAEKDIPNLHEQFELGEYSGLLVWLREKIHGQGQRYRATKLAEVVTGAPLSHKPLVDYMNRKFGEIYGF